MLAAIRYNVIMKIDKMGQDLDVLKLNLEILLAVHILLVVVNTVYSI